jgi:hypothetical protein
MHLRSENIASVCKVLQTTFHHGVNANLYLTPAGSQGFGPHFDDHDVFVLQLEGTKTWRLYDERPVDLPVAGTSKLRFREVVATNPKEVLSLGSGDMLYIPRGQVHEAFSNDSFSLHLTIGFEVVRLVDLLVKALHQLADRNVELRRAVPTGTVHSEEVIIAEVQHVLSSLDIGTEVPRAIREICRHQDKYLHPAPDGHFMSLNALARVDVNTEVVRRSPFVQLHKSAEDIALEFEGKTVPGPVSLEPLFLYIANHRQFCVRHLPDLLDDAAKVELTRKFIREGLLRIQRT